MFLLQVPSLEILKAVVTQGSLMENKAAYWGGGGGR